MDPTGGVIRMVWCVLPFPCGKKADKTLQATLLSLLLTWVGTGRPHYVSQNGSIPYISDVGADFLKPLFITGCSITAVAFFLSLVVERYLRHSGRYVTKLSRASGFGFSFLF